MKPAATTKASPNQASRCAPGTIGLATARPIDTAPLAASISAAHCASRSSPMSRSGSSGSMRVRRHANMVIAEPARTAAVSRTRAVSVTVSHYTCPACARSMSFGRSATAARSAPMRSARSSRGDRRILARLSAVGAADGHRLRGMNLDEAATLTDAMVRSGRPARSVGVRPARRSTSTRPAASATRRRSSSRRWPRPAARSCR